MKRNANSSDPEREPKNDRWLLTYSDMITLLLGLFIILYSMSNIETTKLKAIAKNFSFIFKTVDTQSVSSGTVSGDIDYDAVLAKAVAAASQAGSGASGISVASGSSGLSGAAGTLSGSGVAGVYTKENSLDQVYQSLSKYIDKNHLQNEIDLKKTNNYVSIHLKDMLMFQPDTAVFLSSSKPIIGEVGLALVKVYNYVDKITISGHTADVGEHTKMTDEVSWQLSLDRADEVRKSFVSLGLKEDKISIEGYAHYKPVASNSTEDGRAQNRRVEITIYRNSPDGAESSTVPTSSAKP